MIVTFQFPIIDFRDLLTNKKTNKLPIELYKRNGMIHNFGASYPSACGGRGAVPSYDRYFSAKNLIRFDDIRFQELKPSKGARKISRRYYWDGTAVGRLEISFSKNEGALSINDIKRTISKYAKMPVEIDLGKGKKKDKCTLIKSGNFIAKAYYSSTVWREKSEVKLDSLVKSVEYPICIVQLEQGEKINEIADDIRKIPIKEEEFNFYYFSDKQLKVYVLEPISKDSIGSIYTFMQAISRVNSEKEKFFSLYSFILGKDNGLHKNDDLKKKIIDCISKTQKNLLKNERFGVDINEISNLAFNAAKTIDNDDFKKIEEYSKKIAANFSIEQAQLICNEIDFKLIIKSIDEKLKEYPENSDEYIELKRLQLAAENKSKYWISKIIEGLKVKFRIKINLGPLVGEIEVENKVKG